MVARLLETNRSLSDRLATSLGQYDRNYGGSTGAGLKVVRWKFGDVTAKLDTSAFDCGDKALNALLCAGVVAQRVGTDIGIATRTAEPDKVCGFHMSSRDLASMVMGFGMEHRLECRRILAVAADKAFHGKSLGEELLMNLLAKIRSEGRGKPASLIMVDPGSKKSRFFEKYGFTRLVASVSTLILTSNQLGAAP